MTTSQRLLTVPEAARALAISRSKLYELIAVGSVRSLKIDGCRRVPVESLDDYISSRLAAEGVAA
ncbi:helix-turn-helix domain-containing protein [Haloactinospora alba]|uniref:helix-turn-helix domain-containing protein n=1 Tax=Haloactinospora alba TaxID=405555 RepID=UPI001152A870|nr:helix-turn-helix domain-containing protein [Haloactinospora alba]